MRALRILIEGVFALVAKEQLVQIVEASIDDLIDIYKKTPYFFYTENDLHTYLYHQMCSKLPLEKWKCETNEAKSSILLHKEYPTKERYDAKALKRGVLKGARGHFDLCIWNPDDTRNRVFRVVGSTHFEKEQNTFIVVEFDLIEGNRTLESALHHFKWDLLKLSSTKNEVEHGYQLVFVREWVHRNDFLAKARTEAAKAKNTTVLYVETNNGTSQTGTLSPKLFLNYKPILD